MEEYEAMVEELRRRNGIPRSPARRPAPTFDLANTIGPSEEVQERRAHRKHVRISETASRSSRRILTENTILLLLLIASVYGVYRLVLHVLTQV